MFIIIILVLVSWVMFVIINMSEKNRNKEFGEFLITYADNLCNGETVFFNGEEINKYTELTRYYYCGSFLAITLKRATSFYVTGSSQATFCKFAYTTVTFFAGWWGIPWGIVYTFQALGVNLFSDGTDQVTINDLLISMQNTVN